MTTELQRLQKWFSLHCNGDWEHTYGVTVRTLDNPGWMLEVELRDTTHEGLPFQMVNVQRSDEDWVICSVKGTRFTGAGGVHNLEEILRTFLDWVEKCDDSGN